MQSAWIILVGRIAQTFLIFGQMKLIAYYMSPRELGSYYYILSITNGVGLIICGPMGTYINRKITHYQKQKALKKIFLQFTSSLVTIGILAVFISYFISKMLNVGFSPWLVGIVAFSASFFNTLVPTLNLLSHPKAFIFLTNFGLGLGLAIGVTLAAHGTSTYISWLICLSLGQIIAGSLSLPFLLRGQNEFGSASSLWSKEILKFSIPISIISCCIWVITYSYRIIVQKAFGFNDLGILALSMSVSTATTVAFEYLLQQLLLPRFYQEIEDSSRSIEQAWLHYIGIFISSSAIYCIGMALLAKSLITILIGTQYSQYFYWVIFALIGDFFRMTNNAISLRNHGTYQTGKLIKPYLSGALICLILVGGLSTAQQLKVLPLAIALSHALIFIKLTLGKEKGSVWILEFIKDAKIWLLILLALPLSFVQDDTLTMTNLSVVCAIGCYILFLVYLIFKKRNAFSKI